MTNDTANFLLNLLGSLSLRVGEPDFDQAVTNIQAARTELMQIIGLPADQLPAAAPDASPLHGLTKAQLQKVAGDEGLKVSGNRAELIARIEAHQAEASAA